jgi:hypothetical protein
MDLFSDIGSPFKGDGLLTNQVLHLNSVPSVILKEREILLVTRSREVESALAGYPRLDLTAPSNNSKTTNNNKDKTKKKSNEVRQEQEHKI